MTVGHSAGWAWVLALILLVTSCVALAQAPSPDAEQRRQRLEAFDPAGEPDLAFPEAPDPSARTLQTTEAYQASLRAYYAYRKAGYEHRLSVFEWQSLSTRIIFFVVLLLVLAGIYFAAIQFHIGLRRCDGAAPQETELSLSLSEIKVRSPVLGVIILTMSLAFFYLYLVHVYPIRDVF